MPDGSGEPGDTLSLELALGFNHENCNTLGSIEIEILNNNINGKPPYFYTLIDMTDNIKTLETVKSFETVHQFYNLKEGFYELDIRDSDDPTYRIIRKKFNINFVGEADGSICCPENLIIPSGIISGNFNAIDTISLSIGSDIFEGNFDICNEY